LRRSIALYLVLFAVTAAAQVAEDPGPSILSRGVGVVADTGGSPPTIKPFLSLSGVYDTGLTAVSVDATGKIPQTDDYGAEVGFGAVGSKRWRRTALSIDYRGSLRKYSSASYYDGSDHMLSLSVTRQLPGRLTLILREAAGSYARSFGFASGYAPFDPAIAGVPANELFDSRTTYLSSMANLRFQKSAKLSFGVGGSGTIVRRRSGALVGSTGWSTNADVSYRISRSVSLGADYSFGHTAFTKAFGSSDIHSAGFNATFRLGRRWELGLRAGGARVAMQSLVRIDFDPVVAAIVGQSSAIVVSRNTYIIPSSGANLSRAFRRSLFSIDYRNEPTTGNGVYTTSRSQSTSVRYSFTSLRRLNFGLTAGYTTYISLSQDLGRYRSYSGGVGANYRLKDWLHLTSGYDVRKYDISEAYLRRLAHRVTLGLAFSPGERPLPLR
jgi:hypothetical protein